MTVVSVERPPFPQVIGGVGFHNNDAMLYHVMEREHFNQYIAKTYREISPGFMRTFAGFSDWTKEAMDEFAEYYEQMQKVTDTPMYLTPAAGKYHFTQEEIDIYAENVAVRLKYLYEEKGVKHIRYYCFSNELSEGDYGILNDNLPKFKQYHEALYRAFMRHNLPIGLLATDAAGYENWESIEWAVKNMGQITEDYCVHCYEREHSIYDESFYDFFYQACKKVSNTALRNCKRAILGEIGIQNCANQTSIGNGAVIDTCGYFNVEKEKEDCALMLTEMSFAALNAGIYATAYWSYVDYPDPYSCSYSNAGGYPQKWGEREAFFSMTSKVKFNKWGMLRWEENGDYSAKPHYWALAPLSKLIRNHARVMKVTTDDPLLHCIAVRNHDGSATLGIVNRRKESVEIRLKSDLFGKNLRVYEYDPRNVPVNPFADMQDPTAVVAPDGEYTLKPFSITYFTTDYTEKENSGVCLECHEDNGILTWEESKDNNHCYYRVYASDDAGFTPSVETQIASTVALSLPLKVHKKYYKVLSVDRSGNI